MTILVRLSNYLERKRIKFHLQKTELQLRQTHDDNLSKDLKDKRQQIITLLTEYQKEEKFPKNTDYHNSRLPHIRDKFGTPCAMAYIIEKMGDGKLVEQLHKQNNLVYIDNIHDGPLIKWLENSGITKKEASQIQPEYSPYDNYNFVTLFAIFLLGIEACNFFLVRRFYHGRKRLMHVLMGLFAIYLSYILTMQFHSLLNLW